MLRNRVLICVSGGMVQGVACDDKTAEVIVFDFDNLKEEPMPEIAKILNGDLPGYPAERGKKATDKYLKELLKDTKALARE